MISNTYLTSLTDAEREEIRVKAQEARVAKKENSGNIVVSSEDSHWRELASKHGVRMPQSVCQSSEHKFVKRIARKVEVDINVWIREVVGAKSLAEISDANPNIGAVGVCGLFLEYVEEVKNGIA